jgi:hypothetical protein
MEVEVNMLCQKLEQLESQLIAVRTAQRKPGLTEAQREALVATELERITAVKDHQNFGHDGERCPGE